MHFFLSLLEKLEAPWSNQVLPLISPPSLGRLLLVPEARGDKPAPCPPGPGGTGLTLPCPPAPAQAATDSVLPQKAQLGAAHLPEEPPDAEFVPVSLTPALLPTLPCPPGTESREKGVVIRHCNSLLVWAGRKLLLSRRGK